jgi:hypothetical protein
MVTGIVHRRVVGRHEEFEGRHDVPPGLGEEGFDSGDQTVRGVDDDLKVPVPRVWLVLELPARAFGLARNDDELTTLLLQNAGKLNASFGAQEANTVLPELVRHEILRHCVPLIPVDKREDAAARAIGGARRGGRGGAK